jgi:iron complex outermembrane receptor protein
MKSVLFLRMFFRVLFRVFFRLFGLSLGLALLGLHQVADATESNRQTSAPVLSSISPPTLAAVDVHAGHDANETPFWPEPPAKAPVLRRQSAQTLAEALQDVPSVGNASFGAAVGQMTVRGQDLGRLRLVSNGLNQVDMAAMGPDHAVAKDPATANRIELLQGTTTLRYSTHAVDGVIQTDDERIAKTPLFDAKGGQTGHVGTVIGTNAGQRQGDWLLEKGTDRFQLHVDGQSRRLGDVAVPTEVSCTQNGQTAVRRQLCNGQSVSSTHTLGGTWFADRAWMGVAVQQYENLYGSPAEGDIRLNMRSTRYELQGGIKQLSPSGGLWDRLEWALGQTDYQHRELAGGVVGTQFLHQANLGRLELFQQTRPWLLTQGTQKAISHQGSVGLSIESGRMQALGDEAFIPVSPYQNQALFTVQSWALPTGHVAWAFRQEHAVRESLGAEGLPQFEVARRSFAPRSMALDGLWHVTSSWQVVGRVSHTQRAPRTDELFANGPHMGAGSFDIGRSDLGLEEALNAEIGLNWHDHRSNHSSSHQSSSSRQAGLTFYERDFSRYIALLPTGATTSGLPEYRYQGVQARFRGLEAKVIWPIASSLNLQSNLATLWAQNLSQGEPLPRMAPWQWTTHADWQTGDQNQYHWRLTSQWVAAQKRVASYETPTAGYALLHAQWEWAHRAGQETWHWFIRGHNLTNRLAYSSQSILTQTAPGQVPLAGRFAQLGVRVTF